ncbi:hypothetical protein [Nocardiopsis tropica]|uniref:Uncharacterized protein n=1 Tax=Nocardiopsis tropica TaxID=109330 RepID=A0ABU7KM14_9ACTN|nr:hypothetical protein [Nocardiopsis umidischolae]MEE2050335.1 hypothetical protein [Nocardiopsis umidischolae]
MTDQQDAPTRDDFTDAALAALDSIWQAWMPIHTAVAGVRRGPLGQAVRRRAAVLAARRAHREDGYRDPYVDGRPPSGCALCGLPENYHGNVYTRPIGFHTYTAPTTPDILRRMRARRAARLTRSTR